MILDPSMGKNSVFLLVCVFLPLPKGYSHIFFSDFTDMLKSISVVVLHIVSGVPVPSIQQTIFHAVNELISILYQQNMAAKIRKS